MEFKTMTRQELADKMEISSRTLLRKMKRKLTPDFLEDIEGEILFENQAKHIYEELTGVNKIWGKVQK